MKSVIEKTLFESKGTIISRRADGSIFVDGNNPAVKSVNSYNLERVYADFFSKHNRLFVPTDVAAGTCTIFIISENGDVIQFGQNENTDSYDVISTQNWRDITEIAAEFHAVGLRKDGTVLATGYNYNGQCNVSNWYDIKHIACSLFVTAGIKNDGSVVACGETSKWIGDCSTWENIKSIYCEDEYLLGVDYDGNVYYYGEENAISGVVTEWKNVDKIIAYGENAAALTFDGNVLVKGYAELEYDANALENIVDIVFAYNLIVALDKGGNVLVAGKASHSNFSDFTIRVWEDWYDIIKILPFNAGFIGLVKDGSVVTCLPDTSEFMPEQLSDAKCWECFDSYETIDDDYERGHEGFKARLIRQAGNSKSTYSSGSSLTSSSGRALYVIPAMVFIAAAIIFGAIILTTKLASGGDMKTTHQSKGSKTSYGYSDTNDDAIKISYNSNSNYIFPSDSKYLSKEQLYGLTKEEVALLRNEIYARHGYIFNNEKYKTYFMAKSWYKPNASFNESMFNDIEKANKTLIVEYEIEMGWR